MNATSWPLRSLLIGCGALILSSAGASADDRVVASIKPVHSLVAGVMRGVGEPGLIVDGAGSPHTYSLKPSQAHDLEHAGIVFWVGKSIETFLEKPLQTLAAEARIVTLEDAPGLTKHALRRGGAFEMHDHDADHAHGDEHHDDHAEVHHDDHGHAHQDEHAQVHHDDHDDHAEVHHDDHAEVHHDDHGHAHQDEHAHGDEATDAHIWLDPENAVVMVQSIEQALAAFDPQNAARYAANAAAMTAELEALTADMQATLAPAKNRPFVVFHDAYISLEYRFGLNAVGSITVSPDVMPGAERLAEIRTRVRDLKAVCVFAEPQFEPKLVKVVIEGTDAKAGVLDPLGATIDAGPELYGQLMRQNAASLRDCLAPAS